MYFLSEMLPIVLTRKGTVSQSGLDSCKDQSWLQRGEGWSPQRFNHVLLRGQHRHALTIAGRVLIAIQTFQQALRRESQRCILESQL